MHRLLHQLSIHLIRSEDEGDNMVFLLGPSAKLSHVLILQSCLPLCSEEKVPAPCPLLWGSEAWSCLPFRLQRVCELQDFLWRRCHLSRDPTQDLCEFVQGGMRNSALSSGARLRCSSDARIASRTRSCNSGSHRVLVRLLHCQTLHRLHSSNHELQTPLRRRPPPSLAGLPFWHPSKCSKARTSSKP